MNLKFSEIDTDVTEGVISTRSNRMKFRLTEALVISKRLKFPQDDRTDKNCVASLRMHFQRSKNTLDSLKGVFHVFWRKPSLGAPELCRMKLEKTKRIAGGILKLFIPIYYYYYIILVITFLFQQNYHLNSCLFKLENGDESFTPFC